MEIAATSGVLARVLADRGPTWRYAHALAAQWRDIVTPLPEGAAALIITHAGELEFALVACFPDADHSAWGAPFGPCEGARLIFDGDPARFTKIEILREKGESDYATNG